MKKANYRITGLSPLLIHSTAGMVENPTADLKSKDKILTGRDEAEMGAYRGEGGEMVFPTLWIRGTLYGAASGRKVGKLTARRALAGVILDGEFITLRDPVSGNAHMDFEVDTRFVKIGQARVPRSRAKLINWMAEFALEYDEDFITGRAIEELLNLAGKMIGVGDYRPSTGGGPFGRFGAELLGE